MPAERPANPSEADSKLDSLISAALSSGATRRRPDNRNAAEVASFLAAVEEQLRGNLWRLSDESLQRVVTLAAQNDQSQRFEDIILGPIKAKFPDAAIEARQYDQTGTSWEVVYRQGSRQVRRPIRDILAECAP